MWRSSGISEQANFDVLVGINLLREGLDIPEVSLVAILDADKEGFLRSTRSLIQTIGRAARNLHGRAILYGAFGAVFMTAAGWIFAELYFRNKPESFYTFRDEEAQKEDEAAPSIDDDKDLPGTFASLMPLVVPIVLILLNTTCGMILPEDSPHPVHRLLHW